MFVPEALTAGLTAGVQFGVVWAVVDSAAARFRATDLRAGFRAGLLACAFGAVPFLAGRPAWMPPGAPGRLIQTSFAFFLIAGGAALCQASGVPLFGEAGWSRTRSAGRAVVFLLTVAFFLPEAWGTLSLLEELGTFRGLARGDCLLSALLGFLPPATGLAAVAARFDRGGIGSFFRLPQFLLFLAVVKLVTSGSGGAAGITLIPAVQRGLMKLSHDILHQVLVLFMVPDHPLLRLSVWNFIGVFFGSNLASAVSIFILLALPLLFLRRAARPPSPDPAGATGAERRKRRYLALLERRREAVPVVGFILLVLVLWFSARGEPLTPVYNPVPDPVVEDRGVVMIPLKDPSLNLWNGSLHKFTLLTGGEKITFFVVKKKENELAVCLDACEMCPAVGYGQDGGHLVCLYCNTPIAVESLGRGGGCNPIPLVSYRTVTSLQIKAEELVRQRRRANTTGMAAGRGMAE